MSDVALRVDGLGKRYRIGKRLRYKTLRDTLAEAAGAPWRAAARLFGRGHNAPEASEGMLWALEGVSFDVHQGEVVGIIGRNGAGKSTLLKILSRITEPTKGYAEIHGRVGSLLEVGTGFHPELTGRENIYLNGAILGMRKREIDRKFDEIVAFAEIERFLDTPIKHYSSGMHVRLAFAVAAHLEPDILLVDEVLAVGDATFQKKCLGKINQIAREGRRTVLFVSHDMPAIQNLCTRVFLLHKGKVMKSGAPSEVIEQYFRDHAALTTTPLHQRADRRGEGFARVLTVHVSSATDSRRSTIRCGDRLRVELTYASDRELQGAAFMVGIYGRLNQPLYRLDSEGAGGLTGTFQQRGKLVCITAPLNASPGRYLINLAITMRGTILDHVEQATCFDVEPDDFYGTGSLPSRDGVMCLLHQQWHLLSD